MRRKSTTASSAPARAARHPAQRRLQRRRAVRRRLLPGDAERAGSAGAPPAPTCGPRSSATDNVHVISNALVERIILDKDRAMGVRYMRDGRDEVARAQPRDHPVRRRRQLAAAPDAVGHRPGRSPELARHPAPARPAGRRRATCRTISTPPPAARKTGTTYDTANKLWRSTSTGEQEGPRHLADRRDRAASSRTRPGLGAPDIQLHFLPVLVVDHGRTRMKKDGYSLHVCTLRPESRGTIRLRARDPRSIR